MHGSANALWGRGSSKFINAGTGTRRWRLLNSFGPSDFASSWRHAHALPNIPRGAARARPMPRKLILSHNVQQARPGRAHAAIGAGSKHRPTPPADGGGGRPQRARNQRGKRGAHMMRGGRGRGRCWEAASDGDAPSSSARSAVGPRLGWERPSHGLPGAKNPGEFRGATLRGPDGKHTHTHTHAGKNAHARVGAQGLKKHTSAN